VSEIPLHKIENDSVEVSPPSIKLPKNLFIIGTVNIDETTYMFSPKVLDRANTIEFRLTEKDLEDFIASDMPLKMELLDRLKVQICRRKLYENGITRN
jgi:5-methylcytosine-specific restriction protein B